MKIYRLIYEEIDTEDKFNPDKNIRNICEQSISDYEFNCLGYNASIAIDNIKARLLKEISNKMQFITI